MDRRTKTTTALAFAGVLIAAGGFYAVAGEGDRSALEGAAAVPVTGSTAALPDAGAEVIAGTAGAAASAPETATTPARPHVVVWKSPTCGCCKGWVEYLEDEGFTVTAHDTDDVDAVKAELGLTDPSLKSCHTATIDGYVVEGHVPVSDIERLLAERPDVVGISAPGMPMLSPGMGSREPKDYDVVSFDAEGGQALFSRH